MARFRFLWIEAEDFLPFKRMRVDFEHAPQLVLIVGDRGRERSNGAGKSAIFEALVYAWYGRLLRRIAAGKEIRRGATRCVVRSAVRFSDGRELVVERGRGPSGPFCRLSGIDERALLRGTQQAIDAALGSYEIFMATAMFAGDAASFCRRTDAERKALLERLLGIDGFELAAERAKASAEAVAQALERLQQEQEQLRGSQEQVREWLNEAAREAFLDGARTRRRLREARRLAVEAAEQADQAAQRVAEFWRSAWAQAQRVEEERRRAEAEVERLDAEIAETSEAAARLEAQHAQLVRERRERERQIEALEEGAHPDICPTCGQAWPQDPKAKDVEALVQRHRNAIDRLRADGEGVRLELLELEERMRELRKQRGKALSMARQAAEVAPSWKVRELLADLAEAEATLRTAHAEVLACEQQVTDEPVAVEEVARREREVQRIAQQLERCEEEVRARQQELDDLQFWRKGFGRTGLPSYLLDGVVPLINRTAQDIASVLTDGELRLALDPTATRGTQSVLGITVEYQHGGEGFEAASRGERLRVDVAVLFALREAAAQAAEAVCEQLFLDEVTDGADAHFAVAFVRLLRKRYASHQVVLISHDPTFVSYADQVLVVRKQDDVASVAARS